MSFLVFLTLSREILMYIQNLDWFIWGRFFSLSVCERQCSPQSAESGGGH